MKCKFHYVIVMLFCPTDPQKNRTNCYEELPLIETNYGKTKLNYIKLIIEIKTL